VSSFCAGLIEGGYLLNEEVNKGQWAGHLQVEGVLTHFAKADEADKSHAQSQVQLFHEAVGHLRALSVSQHNAPLRHLHLANSAGAIEGDQLFQAQSPGGMFRLGISLYGLYPSTDLANPRRLQLTPALTWKTKIVQLKSLPPGEPISYGGLYRTHRSPRTLIATLPVGYADGFRRLLTYSGTNRTKPWHVLVRGALRVIKHNTNHQFN